MKYLITGGQFNDAGGRPSGYITKLFDAFIAMDNEGVLVNGGTLNDLNKVINTDYLIPYKALFWFAEVPNQKYRIKDICPHIILVTSIKNNNEHDYMEIINRALKTKSNLIVSFNSMSKNIEATILDPLGNMFCRSVAIKQVAESLYKRVIELMKIQEILICSSIPVSSSQS